MCLPQLDSSKVYFLFLLYKKYRNGASPPAEYGRDRDFNIDLIPKFMMAAGSLVQVLIHTDVTRYLEFKQVDGSYVYRDGKISKVPANEKEALLSPLMGMFEKRRAKKFFEFFQNYRYDDPSTQQGMDLHRVTMSEVYKYFGLESGTQDFIGHALALFLNEEYKLPNWSYLNKPAKDAHERILLYMKSMARYGKSPYIYPMYGLGELPQGFARLSAIYGGTYMLNKPFDGICLDENGLVVGVKSGTETARCKAVIADSSYFPERVRVVGRVVRAICFLKAPIPNTGNAESVQIIIPQRQLNRKTDIYIAMVSDSHSVCPKGLYVAIVSTIVETANPEAEIQPALALLGHIVEKFVSVSNIEEPMADGTKDKIFISKSYDATSHFETMNEDLVWLYRRITGKELEMKQRKSQEEEQREYMGGGGASTDV